VGIFVFDFPPIDGYTRQANKRIDKKEEDSDTKRKKAENIYRTGQTGKTYEYLTNFSPRVLSICITVFFFFINPFVCLPGVPINGREIEDEDAHPVLV
jgi:hypothetical protein